MLTIYTVLVRLVVRILPLLSFGNVKIQKWLNARNQWQTDLKGFDKKETIVWFHCASVGEFEQARPIIDRLSAKGGFQIAVTFFSSSGYEAKHNYPSIDVVTYLPTDLPEAVEAFLDRLQPDVALFVKYEFWFNFMESLHRRRIPMALISAYFPDKHWTIQWPGILLGKRLSQFDVIFTQDSRSCSILSSVMIDNTVRSGDTRVDRVIEGKNEKIDLPEILNFIASDEEVLVIGSNWIQDDKFLIPIIKKNPNIKVIVAPHEMRDDQKQIWVREFNDQLIQLSALDQKARGKARILFIDSIGLLSKLYSFATVAYVGGGFGHAVHNTLEAAVFGIPVIFGPKNKRFQEIQELKAIGVGIEVDSSQSLSEALNLALYDRVFREKVRLSSDEFFRGQAGASEQILTWIEKVVAN